jgi:hypothetical protein
MNTYGVLDENNCHTDVSLSERGAKSFATRNGYKAVSVRHNGGYNAMILATKVNGKWIKYNETA